MIWTVQNTPQVQAVGEIERRASDRVVAIVCGALVEQRLEYSLIWRLRPDTVGHERLFKPTGPFGPFANKIDLGYLLYMYDKKTRDALSAIAKIRNRFAHELQQRFDWQDKELEKQLSRLALHDGLKYYPHPFATTGDTDEKIKKPMTNRELFLVNVKLALITLMRDTHAHIPNSNLPSGAAFTPQKPAKGMYMGPFRRHRKKPGA